MKILVVEDEVASMKFISHLMVKYGECDTASDGIEAVRIFEVSLSSGPPYDLICMDIMMPEMDGHEALQKIRQLEELYSIPPKREVKVIMTTALDDPKNVMNALFKGGADEYLVKPITSANVEEAMKKVKLL
ncbi:response regulator [Maridesulfovibrio frigidus]|uniref:response regulator n=1 Tax=Maridesulfovibrio frigidus TaxID=340956 RepID=UPI0004E282EB|nr:response regulator [Maridesulfovibrio frigidus]